MTESLTARNRDIMNGLIQLKKDRKLYCVFSQGGFVFYKPNRDAQKVRVGSIAAVEALMRDGQRGSSERVTSPRV